jgi:predicted lipoprotein with Yx(FWY)xxD motif
MRTLFTAILGVVTVLPALAEAPIETTRLQVRQDARFGDYLADQTGQPLYVFDQDGRSGKGTSKSHCYDTCARMWPPAGGSPQVSSDLDSNQVKTIDREDGRRQLSYNGWPLYYFAVDLGGGARPGGQGRVGEGGKWFLMRPDGTVIR